MKLTLLIFGVLLLVQFAHPLPVDDSSYSTSSSGEDNTPRERFFKEACSHFADAFLEILRSLSEVFESVIDEAIDVENQSEELKNYLAEFEKFIRDVNEITIVDDSTRKMLVLFNLTSQMANISERYEEACRDHPEWFPKQLLLNNNGYNQFKVELVKIFLRFDTKFTETVDAYVAGLTPEEAKREEKLINWYSQYKNEIDMGAKTEIWLTFMNNFDEVNV